MVEKKPLVLVIFGPTASGKTGLAIALAQKLGGEIVNADSRQVYQFMPVISACPTVEEYKMARHHLFEFVDPKERFSAGAWAQMAEAKIEEILAHGKVPVVVGGTGFYLRALMEGMSEIPEIPEGVEAQFTQKATSTLYADLLRFDPVLAQKLKPNDRQRILRGLVVHAHTGKRLSEWQVGEKKVAKYAFLKIGLKPERGMLHRRIWLRWQSMVGNGVLEEISALREKGYTERDPALRGLAIPDFFAHLEGRMAIEHVLARAEPRDRQYAKRQYTWLNNSYGADVVIGEPKVELVLDFMGKKRPSRADA